jgi:hypothetical protein
MGRRCADIEPRWAFMKRTVIADPLDRTNIYLVRLRIVETPWLACYLHSIRRPDSTRALHNHPWGFVSLLLRGGYTEVFAPDLDAAVDYAKHPLLTPRKYGSPPPRSWFRHFGPGSVHRIRHGEFHVIADLDRRPIWTLLLVGPRRTGWGFATERGFLDEETYQREQRGGEG